MIEAKSIKLSKFVKKMLTYKHTVTRIKTEEVDHACTGDICKDISIHNAHTVKWIKIFHNNVCIWKRDYSISRYRIDIEDIFLGNIVIQIGSSSLPTIAYSSIVFNDSSYLEYIPIYCRYQEDYYIIFNREYRKSDIDECRSIVNTIYKTNWYIVTCANSTALRNIPGIVAVIDSNNVIVQEKYIEEINSYLKFITHTIKKYTGIHSGDTVEKYREFIDRECA